MISRPRKTIGVLCMVAAFAASKMPDFRASGNKSDGVEGVASCPLGDTTQYGGELQGLAALSIPDVNSPQYRNRYSRTRSRGGKPSSELKSPSPTKGGSSRVMPRNRGDFGTGLDSSELETEGRRVRSILKKNLESLVNGSKSRLRQWTSDGSLADRVGRKDLGLCSTCDIGGAKSDFRFSIATAKDSSYFRVVKSLSRSGGELARQVALLENSGVKIDFETLMPSMAELAGQHSLPSQLYLFFEGEPVSGRTAEGVFRLASEIPRIEGGDYFDLNVTALDDSKHYADIRRLATVAPELVAEVGAGQIEALILETVSKLVPDYRHVAPQLIVHPTEDAFLRSIGANSGSHSQAAYLPYRGERGTIETFRMPAFDLLGMVAHEIGHRVHPSFSPRGERVLKRVNDAVSSQEKRIERLDSLLATKPGTPGTALAQCMGELRDLLAESNAQKDPLRGVNFPNSERGLRERNEGLWEASAALFHHAFYVEFARGLGGGSAREVESLLRRIWRYETRLASDKSHYGGYALALGLVNSCDGDSLKALNRLKSLNDPEKIARFRSRIDAFAKAGNIERHKGHYGARDSITRSRVSRRSRRAGNGGVIRESVLPRIRELEKKAAKDLKAYLGLLDL